MVTLLSQTPLCYCQSSPSGPNLLLDQKDCPIIVFPLSIFFSTYSIIKFKVLFQYLIIYQSSRREVESHAPMLTANEWPRIFIWLFGASGKHDSFLQLIHYYMPGSYFLFSCISSNDTFSLFLAFYMVKKIYPFKRQLYKLQPSILPAYFQQSKLVQFIFHPVTMGQIVIVFPKASISIYMIDLVSVSFLSVINHSNFMVKINSVITTTQASRSMLQFG